MQVFGRLAVSVRKHEGDGICVTLFDVRGGGKGGDGGKD